MVVFRISMCKYIHDLSGRGAALNGGRWNSKDTYMLYTAQSRALALLEAVVHMGKVPTPNFCMISIDIPDNSIEKFRPEQLPENWHMQPAPDNIRVIGDYFIRSNKFLALEVPSALMMEEHNYLLNPAHADFQKIKIVSERAISIDERLFNK